MKLKLDHHEGKNKIKCKALCSWLHADSHSSSDENFVPQTENIATTIAREGDNL
jgi:hypothetical protein